MIADIIAVLMGAVSAAIFTGSKAKIRNIRREGRESLIRKYTEASDEPAEMGRKQR